MIPSNKKIKDEIDKIIKLDVYDEIESFIHFNLNDLNEKCIENHLFVVKDTSGSEFKIFWQNLQKENEYNFYHINNQKLIQEFEKKDYRIENQIEFLSIFAKEIQLNKEIIEDNKEKDKESNEEPSKSIIKNHKICIMIDDFFTSVSSISDRYYYLLEEFKQRFREDNINILEYPIVMLIRFEDSQFIPKEIINLSDYNFNIKLPNKLQRLDFFESFFTELSIHTVDLTKLTEMTENWNIRDLKRLLKSGFMRWKVLNFSNSSKNTIEVKKGNNSLENQNESDKIEENTEEKTTKEDEIQPELPVNDNTNEKEEIDISPTKKKIAEKFQYTIPLTIDVFEYIIKEGSIKPLNTFYTSKNTEKLNNQIIQMEKDRIQKNTPNLFNESRQGISTRGNMENLENNYIIDPNEQIISQLNNNYTNSFSTSQLYQFAASQSFEELISVLEKLDQGKLLDDLDRKILADYPFILRDKPKSALIKLTNSKNRVDKIVKMTESGD